MAGEIAISFAAGLAGFLSPCVLPLLPGYVAYMTGAGVGERVPVRRALWGTLAFVGGMTVVFLGLFAAASVVSGVLNEHKRTLEVASGVFIVLLGAVMLLAAMGPSSSTGGVLTSWWPALLRERRFHVRPRAGAGPSFLLGAAFVFGWTPCIGPTLGAALNLAATADGLREGLVLMSAYAIGIGAPFVAAGLGVFRGAEKLKRHALTIQAVGGAVLVAVGLLVATGELTVITRWMQRLMTGANLDYWNF